MQTLLYLYVGTGLFLAVLSIPMILGKIPPNGLYGFRTRQTIENPDIWYPVNTHSGWRLLITGLGSSLGAVILYFIPGPTLDAYALLCLGIFSLLFTIGLVQSIIYLKRLIAKKG